MSVKIVFKEVSLEWVYWIKYFAVYLRPIETELSLDFNQSFSKYLPPNLSQLS